jgi:23S rRNA pseudouridine955/2504/2580 synthase/23S rRNA pseudouridine1911/1915/1917 synthase
MVEGRPPDYLDARGILIADDISSVRKKRKFLEANKKNRLQIYEEMQSNHDARDCRTEFRIMGTANGITILSAILHTGRLHQIRATLCGLGFPVVGDRLYGVDDSLYLKFIQNRETDEDRKRLRMNRTALHCRLLELNHPGNKKRIRFESPIPDDMLALQNFK